MRVRDRKFEPGSPRQRIRLNRARRSESISAEYSGRTLKAISDPIVVVQAHRETPSPGRPASRDTITPVEIACRYRKQPLNRRSSPKRGSSGSPGSLFRYRPRESDEIGESLAWARQRWPKSESSRTPWAFRAGARKGAREATLTVRGALRRRAVAFESRRTAGSDRIPELN